jgi:hypothetical protein
LDVSQLLIHFQKVNLLYILAVFVLFTYSVQVRAKRWQALLKPLIEIPVSPLFSSTMIGYFGNNVLPFRLGELLRGYSLSKECPLKVSSIMGTIILDRVLDFAGLLIFSTLFLFSYPMELWLKTGLTIIAFFLTLVFSMVYLISKKNHVWEKYVNELMSKSQPIMKKIYTILFNVINGFSQLGKSSNKVAISFYTIYLWVIYFACAYLVVIAIGVELSWQQVGLLLIATTLSISVPAAPGYLGTYHAVVIYMMVSVFDMDLAISQSLAIILHAVGFIPFVILGSWFFAKSSIQLAEIKNV